MGPAKKFLYTVLAGVAAGVVLGVLFAPEDGAETRKKIGKLKRKLTFCPDEEDEEQESLAELSAALQEQLDRINKKLAK